MLTAFLLCVGTVASAGGDARAHWKHNGWTAREGAPGSVQAIAQTPDGYLWIGAATGLYRFDGISFERMPRSTGKRAQSEAVGSLAVTGSGDLWVGHDWGGISVVRGDRHVALDEETMGSTMRRILPGRDGALWTIAEGKNAPIIARFAAGKWRTFAQGQRLSDERFGSAVVGRDGTLWMAVGRRLFYLDPRADRMQIVGSPFPAISQVATDCDGNVWLVTPEGLHPVSPSRGGQVATIGPVTIATPKTPGEQRVLFDRDGTLWSISRANGVARFDRPTATTGGRPQPARQSDRFLAGRSAQLVPMAALIDREGNLWIGSEPGLEQFSPASFAPVPVDGVAPTTRWAGTMVMQDGRRDVFLREGDRLFKVQPGQGVTDLPHRLFPDDIPCPSRQGGVWIRDRRDSIVRVGSPTIRRIPLAPKEQDGGLAGGCAEDGSGRLWVVQAARELFGYMTEKGQGAVRLGIDAGKVPNEAIADSSGRILAYVGRGTLWRTDGQKVEAIWDKRDVAIEFIEFLYQGPHYLLMGGPAGLARYDGRRIQVLSSTRFPFLSNLSGAVQTARGETWLQNAKGVLRLSTADLDRAFADPRFGLTGRTFDADDGVPGIGPYFSLSTVTEDKAGRIWIATSGGIAWSDPAALPSNSVPPPVTISALQAGGTRFSARSGLKLPKGISRIEIDYAGLSFTNPKRVRFRYRLDGVDADWIDAGAQRQAFYTNLGPGQYVFRVIAANNDGVWNRTGASLAFDIPPTFAQSRWFLALCVAGLCLLLWSLYSLRLRQVTAGMRGRQEERLAERERIARDLHDTLLQGFQGLILRFQSVANAIPDDQRARKLIDDALDSADAVLNEGRDSVTQLRSVGRDDLPTTLADTAARLRTDNPVAFKMTVEGTPRALHPIVREELARIGDEAIINAFQHAGASIIEVVLSYHRAALLLGVRDDGIGIAPEIARGGGRQGHFGLVGMRERAAQIDAEWTISSRPESGTEILVRVPARIAYAAGRGRAWRLKLRRLFHCWS